MEEIIPQLRTDIDFIPTQYQGQNALIVKDSLGLIQKPLLLQGEILDFLSLIDGKRKILDIQLELMRRKGGVLISSDEVSQLLSQLDSTFLLDSEHYRQEKERIISEYSLLKVRKAFLSGKAYPDTEKDLRSYIESIFQLRKERLVDSGNVLALIAPHIDLEVGKEVYAQAYTPLQGKTPKKIILLGTGHRLHENFFSLSEKDFETPLGLVRTDKKWVKKLKEVGSRVISPSDQAHRSEHSLEFQIIFLQYLFGSDFLLLPVLCGSFHEVLGTYSHPAEIPGVMDFLDSLRLAIEKEASNTLIVAGVDFSHIGPKFGHPQNASFLLLEAKNHDKILIDAICRGDVESFWEEAKKEQNRYNVCGFSTIACLLELLPRSKGQLLGYDFWEEESTQSAVSFAAIVLEDLRNQKKQRG